MPLKFLMGICVGSLLAVPVVSHADTLNFTLPEMNNTYTWSPPSNPVPSSAMPGKEFAFYDLHILLNGSSIYVDNMPPADVSGGYMMGADGYCLGREFLDRDPGPGPRELVIQKQWYSFMLMGRLSYDPTIPDTHFQEVFATRFPGISAFGLYRVLQSASQTMPLITRFFWGDIDIKWFPDSSSRRPADKNYYVLDFAEGESMPGANVLNVRQWRANVLEKRPMKGTTPLQIADALEGESRDTLQSVVALRMQTPGSNAVEFRKTLVDCESLAWLAH